jgi:hypothetical protein
MLLKGGQIMSESIDLLNTTELNYEIENMLKKERNFLLILSPYLDLTEKIEAILSMSSAEIVILCHEPARESDKEKIENLEKTMRNVNVISVPDFHAIAYITSSTLIIAPLNLYEHSQENNFELGIALKDDSYNRAVTKLLEELNILFKMHKLDAKILDKVKPQTAKDALLEEEPAPQEEPPVAEDVPEESPVAEIAPEEEPVAEEAPQEEPPAAEEAPEEVPVVEDAPQEEPSADEDEDIVFQEPLVAEDVPQEPTLAEIGPEEEPAAEEAPQDGELPAGGASEEPPVVEETPQEEEPMAEEALQEPPSDEDEDIVFQEPLVVEDVPQEPTLAEIAPEETPAAEETPEETPVVEETPQEEEPPAAEEAPQEEEPAAEEAPQ